jgi:cation:H+ antiporter
MLAALLLLVGLAVLYFGAEWLITGASDVASHLRLSKSFVGLTLVALGTSAPELFVNLIAASRDHTDFALANVAGSNLTNVCLGFGTSAIMAEFLVLRRSFATDVIFFVLAPCVVLGSFLCTGGQTLSLWVLAVFGLLLAIYLVSLARRREAAEAEQPRYETLLRPVVLLLLGVAALYIGGECTVQSTILLSRSLGIAESLIGLTVVAAGTSIPDVFATIVALRRKEYEIGIGNIFGSNISNVFIVLGGTIIVAGHSLQADPAIVIDYGAVCLLSLAFAVGVLAAQRVTRSAGTAMLLFFLLYFGLRIGFTV